MKHFETDCRQRDDRDVGQRDQNDRNSRHNALRKLYLELPPKPSVYRPQDYSVGELGYENQSDNT